MAKNIITGLCAGAMLVLSSTVYAQQICLPITGSVSTISINPMNQHGVTKVRLGGRPFTLSTVGTITSSDGAGNTYLDHHMMLNLDNRIFTKNDHGVVMGPGDGCSLPVVETINIVGGTGIFTGVTGTGQATGTINLCTARNEFTLSGSLCFTRAPNLP